MEASIVLNQIAAKRILVLGGDDFHVVWVFDIRIETDDVEVVPAN